LLIVAAGIEDRTARQHRRREERRAHHRPPHLLQHDPELAEAEALPAISLGNMDRRLAKLLVELTPGLAVEALVGRHQAPHLLGPRGRLERAPQAGAEFVLLPGEAESHDPNPPGREPTRALAEREECYRTA